jgi:serine/threonine-protein kinase HipA
VSEVSTYVFLEREGAFVPAGLLIMNDDAPRAPWASFAYGRSYLERSDRIAIDPLRLPLPAIGVANDFHTEEGFATFGAIDDAAPDGWGRYLMYKAMADRPPTETEAILASGAERVGALAFGPTPAQPQRITPWSDDDDPEAVFSLEELLQASMEAQTVDLLSPKLRALLAAGSSLGGARPKGVTRRDGAGWIAKFPRVNDPLPECRVEFATMTLAAWAGLDVPSLDLQSAFDRDIYLIARFDREPSSGRRIPFVSGLTMLGAHESEAPRYGYADLADALRTHGSDSGPDLIELFRRMVFNVLVTNDDDHLRNHGFLHDGAGWRLSPLYDVVPKPQVGTERRLAIGVGPEGRAATLENAVAGAARFNVGREQALALVEALARTVRERWEDAFRLAGLSAADRARFATCFRLADPGAGLPEG